MLTGTVFGRRRHWVTWVTLCSLLISSFSGCSRGFWRRQADRDTYNAITEKLNHPHWQVPRIGLNPDTRSRFHDPFDPDCSPLPPDDPYAHELMHCVNGYRGYKNWHKLGTALSIENPQWLEPFGISVQGADPVIGHASVKLTNLTLPQCVELAYIHSREYQTQLEDLYLTALFLTFQRFALGVRFLGPGGQEPGVDFSTVTDRHGNTDGRVFSNFGMRQFLPTGGQIAVELANEIAFVFGSGGGVSASALSYSITQPLMFNAGRKIALEPLTQAERNVLYQARLLARFRQTLFTEVARGYWNLLTSQQVILNIENNIRQLQEQLDAQQAQDSRIFGLLTAELEKIPEGLQIPPELSAKLVYDLGYLKWRGTMSLEEQAILESMSADGAFQAAAEQIISFARNEATPLAQAELRTRLNRTQLDYENARREIADDLDSFKISLGLPPNIQLDIDSSLLAPFELISMQLINTEKSFRDLDIRLGGAVLPAGDEQEGESLPQLRLYLSELSGLRNRLRETGLQAVQHDFEPLRDILELTEENWQESRHGLRFFSDEEERDRVVGEVERDLRFYRISERDFSIQSALLDMLTQVVSSDDPAELLRQLDRNQSGRIEIDELPPLWADLPRTGVERTMAPDGSEERRPEGLRQGFTISELLDSIRRGTKILKDRLTRNAQALQVLQAGLRAETVALNQFVIDGIIGSPDIEEVVRIGLEYRHDLMNARARVMDRRRAVEIAANQLEAGLDLRFTGNQAFDGINKNQTAHRAGVKFTTPLDQIDERNSYNQRLIEYQRERRNYMLQEDLVKNQIRRSWRQIQVQRTRIEINRQTIRNAARQYDNASLNAARGTQANALSLLQALETVLGASNSMVRDWVTYETNRLNIFRDMGTMLIDPRCVWLDQFYLEMEGVPAIQPPVVDPPPLPDLTPASIPPVSISPIE